MEQVILHPDFGSPSQISNDYALIKLKEPVENHPLATLNEMEPDDIEEAVMTVVGWGATREGAFGGSSVLQKVEVPLVGKDKCIQQFLDFNPNFSVKPDDLMFCAGFDEGGKDACQGHSDDKVPVHRRALSRGSTQA